jgi:imidazolonepropionase-like amidohydrolase
MALRAGTIHAVEGGATFEDGVIVVQDGKITAVGAAADIEIPANATTMDYGSEAVIVPGFVAADSAYASPTAGPRTADPTLLAIDHFDPYSNLISGLKSGITTVYLAPARGRLIAGQGAVVKTAGGEMGSADARVLLESAGLHGSISEEARRTPGYWEPPVPATVDVGLGVESPQLPRTTMGAVLAIEELMAFAGGDRSFEEEYGRQTGPALAEAMKRGATWRLGAETQGEVAALLDLAARFEFPLVVDGASQAASLAEEIAAAGVPVIARPHYERGRNVGKTESAKWPNYDVIARLVGEGVQVAITVPSGLGASEIRFAAALAMRGGLSEADALAGITLNAAKVLGVDERVGSLSVGKDADIVVMTGSPLSVGASVVATYVGGSEVWNPAMASAMTAGSSAGSKAGSAGGAMSAAAMSAAAASAGPIVISVDELHVGNGVVHSPGEILVRDGKIAQVAAQVARPAGAAVVRGASAMPGMIDAYGHLGTEGGRRAFTTRLDLSRMLEPGDYADRQVARNGVTTVNMISQNLGGITPSIAYKPAADSFDHLVVDSVAAVRLQWDSAIIAQSGASVTQQLKKAKAYADSWVKYEADMAKWTPPAPPAADDDDSDEDEDEDDDEDEDKDDKKKKKKKERDPAKSVTGVFAGTFTPAADAEAGSVRFRFLESADGSIEGTARMAGFDDLLNLTGSRSDYDVTLTIQGPDGDFEATLAQIYSNDPPPKKSKKSKKSKDDDDDKDKDDAAKKDGDEEDEDDSVKTYLRGEVKSGEAVLGTVDVTQTSAEYKVAKRIVKAPDKTKAPRPPKGMPKKPSMDPDLEPIRRAMSGEAAVIVKVTRDDQILACVDRFEEYGIKPVLIDADDVHKVADRIAGRVAGVLVPMNRMVVTEKSGLQRNRLVEVSAAGIPVAFLSQREEGAAELSVMAARAVAQGLAPSAALKGLTSDAAKMLCIGDRVGTLETGMDADIVILDGNPMEISSSILRVFVNGKEIR